MRLCISNAYLQAIPSVSIVILFRLGSLAADEVMNCADIGNCEEDNHRDQVWISESEESSSENPPDGGIKQAGDQAARQCFAIDAVHNPE